MFPCLGIVRNYGDIVTRLSNGLTVNELPTDAFARQNSLYGFVHQSHLEEQPTNTCAHGLRALVAISDKLNTVQASQTGEKGTSYIQATTEILIFWWELLQLAVKRASGIDRITDGLACTFVITRRFCASGSILHDF
eukprot:6180400-Pleurochrysis_carterae.AAC.4